MKHDFNYPRPAGADWVIGNDGKSSTRVLRRETYDEIKAAVYADFVKYCIDCVERHFDLVPGQWRFNGNKNKNKRATNVAARTALSYLLYQNTIFTCRELAGIVTIDRATFIETKTNSWHFIEPEGPPDALLSGFGTKYYSEYLPELQDKFDIDGMANACIEQMKLRLYGISMDNIDARRDKFAVPGNVYLAQALDAEGRALLSKALKKSSKEVKIYTNKYLPTIKTDAK